jgi:hypothetical protein
MTPPTASATTLLVYDANLHTLCQGFSLCDRPTGRCKKKHPTSPVKWRFPTRYLEPKKPQPPHDAYSQEELLALVQRWLPLEYQVGGKKEQSVKHSVLEEDKETCSAPE